LSAPDEDLWLPSTDAATARQMVRRAFAAEFLMPIRELKQVIGSEFTNEGIENAATVFGVSALAVRSRLANDNLISRF
jgi:Zn-dependent peptidase ImmA (M78 family)